MFILSWIQIQLLKSKFPFLLSSFTGDTSIPSVQELLRVCHDVFLFWGYYRFPFLHKRQHRDPYSLIRDENLIQTFYNLGVCFTFEVFQQNIFSFLLKEERKNKKKTNEGQVLGAVGKPLVWSPKSHVGSLGQNPGSTPASSFQPVCTLRAAVMAQVIDPWHHRGDLGWNPGPWMFWASGDWIDRSEVCQIKTQ